MKKIKASEIGFNIEAWQDVAWPNQRLSGRWKLAGGELLAEHWPMKNDFASRTVYRKSGDKWQRGYAPFKSSATAAFSWLLGTDIGSGVVLRADGVAMALRADYRVDANGIPLVIFANGSGDGCHEHKVYIDSGKEKAASLLTFGHRQIGFFKVRADGCEVLAGESWRDNEVYYGASVGRLPAGEYEVYGSGNGNTRVCKVG